MSQTPTAESRAQRRARERQELKAAKRLASFNSDTKTLSTDSIPTKASLNNKKKHRKSNVSPTRPSFDTQVSSSPGSKISAVVGKSPCKLIMVESAGAPFVSVEATYFMKVSVAPTITATKPVEQQPVVNEPEVVEAPKVEAPLVEQTPQKENSQENNGGNSSLVDPTVDDTMNAAIVTEAEKESERSSEIAHSSIATPETTVIASSPACNDSHAEPNKSAVTLIGNEESEKPSAPQQQANTPAPTLQTVNTPPVETSRSKSPSGVNGKKSPNLLDILKEKSKKSKSDSKKEAKESKKKPWQFWKK
ncbi:hypothetical protein K450DRAFT_239433 [Umbelopsis ramanniana AG]|uniref:Uncharacterized protein n=1 Tax=Umbelopsis ramanniana AG TaxID=1314678 RepID=A0AAD5EAW1_UMBRA|nr:uncharacterized protein K450DRAFT_239433 [Umbelopsis ramanniana AG]KAI8580104.1 hypothetical protein K450DRAFT_239433 [Umbelopsis ramanniana AG]